VESVEPAVGSVVDEVDEVDGSVVVGPEVVPGSVIDEVESGSTVGSVVGGIPVVVVGSPDVLESDDVSDCPSSPGQPATTTGTSASENAIRRVMISSRTGRRAEGSSRSRRSRHDERAGAHI
jgi:hypothetical protein